METLLMNRHDIAVPGFLSVGYRVPVTEVPARLALVSGAMMPASFFLGTSVGVDEEHEGLWPHLNNKKTQFVVTRCETGITLVCIDAIAYVCVAGQTPETESHEHVGAPHHAARVRLCTGEELRGDFVSVATPDRARLSDLLNEPGQRFLLFASGSSTYIIHRNAVQQVSPL